MAYADDDNHKTVLLISDIALGVYGFVERADAGASLIANKALNKQIWSLRQLLPVHYLTCEFEKTPIHPRSFDPPPPEDYWMVLHHFRRDLTYSDVRRFKIPPAAGLKTTAADCALIRRYLSNCHVAGFNSAPEESRFTVKMLAALVECNFSLGRLRLSVLDAPLTDYRSTDAFFRSGMRLGALNLFIEEDYLQRLIKTTDFLRMPVVQRLSEFKLFVVYPGPSTRRQRAVLSSPLWTAGVHLLRNCAQYRVDCSTRHVKSLALKLVHICEEFERGNITEIAGHCVFRFPWSSSVTFPFKKENEFASQIEVDEKPWAYIASYKWDVYRFQNAVTHEWLTACFAHSPTVGYNFPESVLYIVKGQAYPDISYNPDFDAPLLTQS